MLSYLFILFGLFYAVGFAQVERTTPLLLPVGSSLQESSFKAYALDSAFVYRNIDSIITNGIKNNAFPGAQVLVAKEGNIIFHHAYGYHTYDSI